MHTQLSQHKKLMAVVMLFVFLFTQVAIAAAPPQSSTYTDPNSSTSTGGQQPVFTNNSNQAVLGTADQLSNYYFNQFKNSWGWDWLKTTNVNFSAFSGGTPQWNINTFQPLTMKENLNNFLFAQGQYGTNTNTVNVGLGYRSMDANHSSMYGVNLFYDWQTTVQGEGVFTPTGSHMRIGAGLEYFTGSIETRINGYYGVSSDVQVGSPNANGIAAFQHVAPGGDISIGTDFSFWNAPWLKLTATGNYYQQTQGGTINGYQGSPLYGNLTAQLQVTPQLSINGGGTFGNGGQSNANIGFQFNLLAPPTPALFLADAVANKLAQTDISYKMLQPVQRNNSITVERYSKTTPATIVAVINTAQPLFTPALTVSALDSAGAIVASSQTSANGQVTLQIPASGNYDLSANYFGTVYAPNSNNNTKDIAITANCTLQIDLPIELGSLEISTIQEGGASANILGVPITFQQLATNKNTPNAAIGSSSTTYTTTTNSEGKATIYGLPSGQWSATAKTDAGDVLMNPVTVDSTTVTKGTIVYNAGTYQSLTANSTTYKFDDANGKPVTCNWVVTPINSWSIPGAGSGSWFYIYSDSTIHEAILTATPIDPNLGLGSYSGHISTQPRAGMVKTILIPVATGPAAEQVRVFAKTASGSSLGGNNTSVFAVSTSDINNYYEATNNNGAYTFNNLPSGDYYICGMSQGFFAKQSFPVHVVTGQNTLSTQLMFDINTAGKSAVSITYTDSNNHPIPNVYISAGPSDNPTNFGKTTNNGNVQFYIAPGPCSITADIFGSHVTEVKAIAVGPNAFTIKKSSPTPTGVGVKLSGLYLLNGLQKQYCQNMQGIQIAVASANGTVLSDFQTYHDNMTIDLPPGNNYTFGLKMNGWGTTGATDKNWNDQLKTTLVTMIDYSFNVGEGYTQITTLQAKNCIVVYPPDGTSFNDGTIITAIDSSGKTYTQSTYKFYNGPSRAIFPAPGVGAYSISATAANGNKYKDSIEITANNLLGATLQLQTVIN